MTPSRVFSTIAALLILVLVSTPMPTGVKAGSISTLAAETLGITHGAHLPPRTGYDSEISGFNSLTGKAIGIVMYFQSWSGGNKSYPYAFDDYLIRFGVKKLDPSIQPAVMITWEPRDGTRQFGCDQDYAGIIPPSVIIQGKCDAYIREYAHEIAGQKIRIIIRFAHEMNISDSGWWPGHYGGDASLYVSMYQHVHDVFMQQVRADGASNVEWIWSPNYESNPLVDWNSIWNYYPGDSYVDWIGLSGYNWYNATGHSMRWMTFTDLYDSVLKNLACHFAKPVVIAEVGSIDGSGNLTKASWIADMYARLPEYPFVRGVVWFNDYANATPGLADFRVSVTGSTGNQSSLEPYTSAYRSGISSAYFRSNLPTVGQATPTRTYCGPNDSGFSLRPTTFFTLPGRTTSISLDGMLFTGSQVITFTAPPGIQVQSSSPQLDPPWDRAMLTFDVSKTVIPGSYTLKVNVGSTAYDLTLLVVDKIYTMNLPFTKR